MHADPPSILIVDDNGENRALVAATLEDEGYRVIAVASGAAAIEAFARERPTCILMDVRMPEMDGPTACARIRALPGGADVSIVFVTALRDVETFDRTVAAGGDDFMTKPFRTPELIARVQAAVKLRRLTTERHELYAQVKQQRDDLQRVQLQKEQIIAFLVHDLKNPVNAIGLHVELLLRDRECSNRGREIGHRIRDESRTLLRRIVAFLDIAKTDEGKLVPACRPVALGKLVADVFAELEGAAQSGHVQLVADIGAMRISADDELLRRILENLIENALRYAPEDSDILVTARLRDRDIEICVRDRGAGVALEHREHVFERFTQVDRDGTRSNRGLGLAFCKLAVEAHGARIWIEDASPGAAFFVRFPDSDVAPLCAAHTKLAG